MKFAGATLKLLLVVVLGLGLPSCCCFKKKEVAAHNQPTPEYAEQEDSVPEYVPRKYTLPEYAPKEHAVIEHKSVSYSSTSIVETKPAARTNLYILIDGCWQRNSRRYVQERRYYQVASPSRCVIPTPYRYERSRRDYYCAPDRRRYDYRSRNYARGPERYRTHCRR